MAGKGKTIINCVETSQVSPKSLKAKLNASIKEELKAYVQQHFPGYRCTDAFKFMDNPVTHDKTLFFIPDQSFICVTKSGSTGAISADVSRVVLTDEQMELLQGQGV